MNFSASLMNMNLLNLGSDIRIIDPFVSNYHIDILDWHYVENLGLTPLIAKSIRPITKKPIEGHIYMDEINESLINLCIDCGIDIVTVPSDIVGRHVNRLANLIHRKNKKFGVFLNPSQPISIIEEYSNLLDQLIILSVDPGFSGQTFISSTYHRVEQAVNLRKLTKSNFRITVDGNCNKHNFQKLKDSGADTVVLGRSLFNDDTNLKRSVISINNDIQELN